MSGGEVFGGMIVSRTCMRVIGGGNNKSGQFMRVEKLKWIN